MTVNKLIKILQETGDEKFRNSAIVRIDGYVELYDDENDEVISNRIERDIDEFDVKVGVNSVDFNI